MAPLHPPAPLEGENGRDKISVSDLSAVISSYTQLVQVFEQVSDRLDVLPEVKADTAAVRTELQGIRLVLEQVVTKIGLQMKEAAVTAVIEKQLDITDEQSRISKALASLGTVMSMLDSRVKYLMIVCAVMIAVVGGPQTILGWVEYKHRQDALHPHVDASGRMYYLSQDGDTLWVSSIRSLPGK